MKSVKSAEMPVPASPNDSVMLACIFAGPCRIVPLFRLWGLVLFWTRDGMLEHASIHAIWTQAPQARQVRRQSRQGSP